MYDDIETKLLYDDVFKLYYRSELRAWDIDSSTGYDRHLYDQVVNSVHLIANDYLTGAPVFEAPSSWAAAIFLMDKQSRRGLVNKPGDDQIDDKIKVDSFKVVFRGQSGEHANFHPTLWRYSQPEQDYYNLALPVFCWLMKLVTEDGCSHSIQAHLYHGAAQSYEIPTDLLDWTLDPAVAIIFAGAGLANGAKGAIYFTDFENEPQLTLILPPPFVRQLFDERDFFHYTSSKAQNNRLYHAASQVIFPINNTFARAASFPYLDCWSPSDEILHDVASKALEIAKQLPPDYFAGLDSKYENIQRDTFEKFKADHKFVIEELLKMHRITRSVWDKICERWIQETHCFLNELFVFPRPDGKIYVSDRIYEIPRRNRDAIRLYCEWMLTLTHPSVTEKKSVYKRLLATLDEQEKGNETD